MDVIGGLYERPRPAGPPADRLLQLKPPKQRRNIVMQVVVLMSRKKEFLKHTSIIQLAIHETC